MLDTRKMLSEVNGEITRLGKIRDLLMTENGTEAGIRPLAVKTATAKDAGQPATVKKKRHLSPEGRAAIAAATKRRWAAAKKAGLNVPKGSAKKKKAAKKKAAKSPKSQAQAAAAV